MAHIEEADKHHYLSKRQQCRLAELTELLTENTLKKQHLLDEFWLLENQSHKARNEVLGIISRIKYQVN